MGGVFGAAFLLLEENYHALGYEGPPRGYPTTNQEAVSWHEGMPAEWWSLSSIPYALWGRDSKPDPAEVTLPLDVPVPLLRAQLDSSGRFEFTDLPEGRHTLFIRWGRNPDPQNNISGPFEVNVDARDHIQETFPVNAFDMIDT